MPEFITKQCDALCLEGIHPDRGIVRVRKLFVLVVIVFIALVALNRQRLFLRDPLAKLYRNSVEVNDARVFINYSNDVLVEEPGGQLTYLVQNWSKVPGTPKALTCLHAMVCWTGADQAEMVPLGGTGYAPNTQMDSREVSFNDGSGTGIRVTLR
jgi:hypothetical protein